MSSALLELGNHIVKAIVRKEIVDLDGSVPGGIVKVGVEIPQDNGLLFWESFESLGEVVKVNLVAWREINSDDGRAPCGGY
jgi:hypothetical protein